MCYKLLLLQLNGGLSKNRLIHIVLCTGCFILNGILHQKYISGSNCDTNTREGALIGVRDHLFGKIDHKAHLQQRSMRTSFQAHFEFESTEGII